MRTKKEARAAKKLENEHLQAERRARREVGGSRRGHATDGGGSAALGNEAHMPGVPAQLSTEAAAPMLWWPPTSTPHSLFFLNPSLMMPGPFLQPFQRSHELNSHPWITQSTMPGRGDNMVGSQLPGVWVMAPDSGGNSVQSRGMGTWQGNLWGM